MYPGMKKKALERRDAVAKRKYKMTHAQRQERFQQLKEERLQREKEEYESLPPEQKRRRDLRDEKRAKKLANSRKARVSLALLQQHGISMISPPYGPNVPFQ